MSVLRSERRPSFTPKRTKIQRLPSFHCCDSMQRLHLEQSHIDNPHQKTHPIPRDVSGRQISCDTTHTHHLHPRCTRAESLLSTLKEPSTHCRHPSPRHSQPYRNHDFPGSAATPFRAHTNTAAHAAIFAVLSQHPQAPCRRNRGIWHGTDSGRISHHIRRCNNCDSPRQEWHLADSLASMRSVCSASALARLDSARMMHERMESQYSNWRKENPSERPCANHPIQICA